MLRTSNRVIKTEKNSHQKSFTPFPVDMNHVFLNKKTIHNSSGHRQTEKTFFQAVLFFYFIKARIFSKEREKEFGECYSSREKRDMFNMVVSFTSFFAFKQIQFNTVIKPRLDVTRFQYQPLHIGPTQR